MVVKALFCSLFFLQIFPSTSLNQFIKGCAPLTAGFFPIFRLRMGQLRSFLLTGAKASPRPDSTLTC